MENYIALMVLGYLLLRIGMPAAVGYLFYRDKRRVPVEVRVESEVSQGARRLQGARRGR